MNCVGPSRHIDGESCGRGYSASEVSLALKWCVRLVILMGVREDVAPRPHTVFAGPVIA